MGGSTVPMQVRCISRYRQLVAFEGEVKRTVLGAGGEIRL